MQRCVQTNFHNTQTHVLHFIWTHHCSYETSFFKYMSVGWDVKWCPVSRITTPWHAKDRFSGFRRRVGSWGPPGKLKNFITNSHRRYMAGILPVRRKTQNNQSINLSNKNNPFLKWHANMLITKTQCYFITFCPLIIPYWL